MTIAVALLTVPARVYPLRQTAQDATTSSLVIVIVIVIVGVTEGAGALARAGRIRWRTGTAFGIAGIVAAFAGTALNHRVDAHVLLLGFSGVMLIAATGMLIRARSDTKRAAHPTTAATARPTHEHPVGDLG